MLASTKGFSTRFFIHNGALDTSLLTPISKLLTKKISSLQFNTCSNIGVGLGKLTFGPHVSVSEEKFGSFDFFMRSGHLSSIAQVMIYVIISLIKNHLVVVISNFERP